MQLMSTHRIIQAMLHIYRIYKFVKLVDEENLRLANESVLAQLRGAKTAGGTFELVADGDAMIMFSQRRILLKKVGLIRASQISMSALREKYLEPTNAGEKIRHLRVTHLKGLPLLDGVPFVRFGLWKAWHEEHGWLLVFFVASFGLGLGSAVRHLWEKLSSLL